jgi:hypothetical protein
MCEPSPPSDAAVAGRLQALEDELKQLGAMHTEASRAENHRGNQELDAYNDGKAMAYKDAAHRVWALLRQLDLRAVEAPHAHPET